MHVYCSLTTIKLPAAYVGESACDPLNWKFEQSRMQNHWDATLISRTCRRNDPWKLSLQTTLHCIYVEWWSESMRGIRRIRLDAWPLVHHALISIVTVSQHSLQYSVDLIYCILCFKIASLFYNDVVLTSSWSACTFRLSLFENTPCVLTNQGFW